MTDSNRLAHIFGAATSPHQPADGWTSGYFPSKAMVQLATLKIKKHPEISRTGVPQQSRRESCESFPAIWKKSLGLISFPTTADWFHSLASESVTQQPSHWLVTLVTSPGYWLVTKWDDRPSNASQPICWSGSGDSSAVTNPQEASGSNASKKDVPLPRPSGASHGIRRREP